MKRNRNAYTIARGNINCKTNLESILAKLSIFKDTYNQSYDPKILFPGIQKLPNEYTQRHVHITGLFEK